MYNTHGNVFGSLIEATYSRLAKCHFLSTSVPLESFWQEHELRQYLVVALDGVDEGLICHDLSVSFQE